MVLSEEIQKKYGFLLQPIKDLTKNWEIDVTGVLETYLEELENTTVEFDNGKSVLNFAEASLLIQGTASVWSKKVEYLYVLVRQTADMISSKGKEAKEQADKTSSVDDVNFHNDDEDKKLLNLDDVAVTSKRGLAMNYDPINPIPITPVAMLEIDLEERGRAIISQNKNDSVCHTNDFWENRFIPFPMGISILDRDSGGELDKIVIPCLEELENAPVNFFRKSSDNENNDIANDVPDDIDNNDGMVSMDSDPGCADPFMQNTEEKEPTVIEKMQLRPRLLVNPVKTVNVSNQLPSVLDPYAECKLSSWIDKSYKKLKSYRVPASILKKTRKRKISEPQEKVQSICEFLTNKKFNRKETTSMGNSLSRFSETERKRRNLLWNPIRRCASCSAHGDDAFKMPMENIFHDNDDDDDDDDIAGHMDPDSSIHSATCPPDLDDLIGDVQSNVEHNGPEPEMTHFDGVASYEDLVRHHVELFYSAARRSKEETALARRVKVWDESITPKLAEQDLRPEFDIHKYGAVMLKKFDKPQDSKLFADVVGSSDRWYICRLFAATLQLANDNNFGISRHDDFRQSVNTMELKLLSKHQSCERFDDYNIRS